MSESALPQQSLLSAAEKESVYESGDPMAKSTAEGASIEELVVSTQNHSVTAPADMATAVTVAETVAVSTPASVGFVPPPLDMYVDFLTKLALVL